MKMYIVDREPTLFFQREIFRNCFHLLDILSTNRNIKELYLIINRCSRFPHFKELDTDRGNRLQHYSQFLLFVFVLGVNFRGQFSDPQRLKSHQEVLSTRGGSQNLEALYRWSLFTFFTMFGDGLALLRSMLISTGFEMTASETDIARFTARTRKFIHNPAPDFLFNWRFKRWHYCS